MAELSVSFSNIFALGTPHVRKKCKKASSEHQDLASVIESTQLCVENTRYSIKRYLPQSVSQPSTELVSAKLWLELELLQ